jgi:hypothetical protein
MYIHIKRHHPIHALARELFRIGFPKHFVFFQAVIAVGARASSNGGDWARVLDCNPADFFIDFPFLLNLEDYFLAIA